MAFLSLCRPRRAMFQRVLRLVHICLAVVATPGRIFPDSVEILPEAPVSREHLRHPVGQGRCASVQPNFPVWEDGPEDP
jgi:hypothetical protein